MHNILNKKIICATLLVLVLLLVIRISASACSVPVFRYALERWVPDNYMVVVNHQQPLPESLETAVNELLASDMNLVVQEDNSRALTGARNSELRLHFPSTMGIGNPIWTGPLSVNKINAVMRSPLRMKIADMILGGESIVWLLLEGSNKQQNSEASKLLSEELLRNQADLKLPTIDETDTHIAEAPGRAPLKIAFSMLSLSKNDANETILVNTLLNSNPEYLKNDLPMVFPICGAGRAFPPLVGDAINAENIYRVCLFLTGECSCEIKGQNPGFDLPITTNWGCIESGQSYTEIILPPLTGVVPEEPIEFQFNTLAECKESKIQSTGLVVNCPSELAKPAQSLQTLPLTRTIIVTIIFMVLAVIAISVAIRRSCKQ